MPHKIVYSVAARNDLVVIARNLTEYANMNVAVGIVQKIYEKIENLAYFPEMGRLRNDGKREIFPERYRVVYRIDDEKIIILTILHSRMMYPRELIKNYK